MSSQFLCIEVSTRSVEPLRAWRAGETPLRAGEGVRMGLRERPWREKWPRVLLRERALLPCAPLRESLECPLAFNCWECGVEMLWLRERDFLERLECFLLFFFLALLLMFSTSARRFSNFFGRSWRLSNFLDRSFTNSATSDIFWAATRVQAKKKAEVGLRLWDFVLITRRVYKLRKAVQIGKLAKHRWYGRLSLLKYNYRAALCHSWLQYQTDQSYATLLTTRAETNTWFARIFAWIFAQLLDYLNIYYESIVPHKQISCTMSQIPYACMWF